MATKTKKGKKPEETDNQVEIIKCPECSCDYIIPVFQIMFAKSFAGNKIQSAWPDHDGANDTATVGCPKCGIVYTIGPDGSLKKTGNSWKK